MVYIFSFKCLFFERLLEVTASVTLVTFCNLHSDLSARGAETADDRLYICQTAARGELLGFPWERSVLSPIVELLPLLKYAYSLKIICGAKLVTAYLV